MSLRLPTTDIIRMLLWLCHYVVLGSSLTELTPPLDPLPLELPMLYDHWQSAPHATLPLGKLVVTLGLASWYFQLLLAASSASLVQLYCYLPSALSGKCV